LFYTSLEFAFLAMFSQIEVGYAGTLIGLRIPTSLPAFAPFRAQSSHAENSDLVNVKDV